MNIKNIKKPIATLTVKDGGVVLYNNAEDDTSAVHNHTLVVHNLDLLGNCYTGSYFRSNELVEAKAEFNRRVIQVLATR